MSQSDIDRYKQQAKDALSSPTPLIKKTYLTIKRQIEQSLRSLNITSQQSQALHEIAIQPGITNHELEHQLLIEKSSVTSLMNGIEKRGWIIRNAHPDDARMKQNTLTTAGEQKYIQAQQAVNEVKSRSTHTFTAEELEHLKQLLNKLIYVYQ